MWGEFSLDLETEETEREIIKYVDLRKVFKKAIEIGESIQLFQEPCRICKAGDLFAREDFYVEYTEDNLGIFIHDGELWEFDPQHLNKFGDKGHPWNEYLKPLGIFELLREVDIGMS